MTHVITRLCLRDSGCVDVCPVECIVPGNPTDKYPMYYIDPDQCIDCGACITECPFGAIFHEDEVPSSYVAKGGEFINQIGLTGHYEGTNHHNAKVILDCTRKLAAGEVLDLTPDTQLNADFFQNGPGYKSKG